MSREERVELANQVLKELRGLSYEACRDMMKRVSNREVAGKGGKKFQVEVQAVWDDGRHDNIRVMVSVSDDGLSDFAPTSVDFIIAPNGSFVGEG